MGRAQIAPLLCPVCFAAALMRIQSVINTVPEKIASICDQNWSEWDRHTPETYREEAAILSICQGRIAKANFENLEKTFGLNYNPTGAVFDEHCQKIFSPVTHQYEDSMHTFYASGGIASCMQKYLVKRGSN